MYCFYIKLDTILNQFEDVDYKCPSLEGVCLCSHLSLHVFSIKGSGIVLFCTRLSNICSTHHGYILPCVVASIWQSLRGRSLKRRVARIWTQDLWIRNQLPYHWAIIPYQTWIISCFDLTFLIKPNNLIILIWQFSALCIFLGAYHVKLFVYIVFVLLFLTTLLESFWFDFRNRNLSSIWLKTNP